MGWLWNRLEAIPVTRLKATEKLCDSRLSERKLVSLYNSARTFFQGH
jgi:hypothetical protein